MHPTISAELDKARTADLHRQAERHQLVQAAMQARRARRDSGLHTAPGRTASRLARRALAMLTPTRPRPAR
jgi:hypothetical protein